MCDHRRMSSKNASLIYWLRRNTTQRHDSRKCVYDIWMRCVCAKDKLSETRPIKHMSQGEEFMDPKKHWIQRIYNSSLGLCLRSPVVPLSPPIATAPSTWSLELCHHILCILLFLRGSNATAPIFDGCGGGRGGGCGDDRGGGGSKVNIPILYKPKYHFHQ
jgi:hypothetical protein